jgi:hypothetical protein
MNVLHSILVDANESIQNITCSINAGAGLTSSFLNSSWNKIDMHKGKPSKIMLNENILYHCVQ